jgi:thiol-disulfide isomerase/thioredoxin
MIYKIFHDFYDYRSPDISLDSVAAMWQSYKKYINNPVLIKTVNEDVLNSEKQINEKDSSINSNLIFKYKSVEKFFKTLHSKHKDKIIYIDIWATWCGPCRIEIPYSIDLQNYFKNKPIAFVNLCFESYKNEWEKAIVNENIKGDNYFLSSDESKLFRDELKFAGFPTYMILDKKGKLINKDAPRPSSRPEIINLLNKLTKG